MDLSNYKEDYSFWFNLKRHIWYVVNATLFRCLLYGKLCSILRNMILRSWGADIPNNSYVYASCKIWAPWNLKIGNYSCIGPNTQIYNKAPITIGNNSVVSQGSYLCTASHDINDVTHKLIMAPITVKDQAWIASDAFVGMGVTIGEGAVVGARGCVFKDVPAWTVVGGNPAKFIKNRIPH